MAEPNYDMSPEELYGDKGNSGATGWQAQAYEQAQAIDDDGEGLTPWEISFIAGVIDGEAKFISRKMADKIEQIYEDRLT